MSKLWNLFKEKFFCRQFISFVIIGFLNTLINFVVLELCLIGFNKIFLIFSSTELVKNSLPDVIFRMISVTIAFIVATVFSYFANSRFSFNNKNYSFKKLLETVGVLLVRLCIVLILTEIMVRLLGFTALGDYVSKETFDSISNLVASIIMIPFAYLVLEKILRVNKVVEENEASID